MSEILIDLEEGSGPVTPRHQYTLSVRVERDDDGALQLSYAHHGFFVEGKPIRDIKHNCTIEPGALDDLYQRLVDAGVEGCADDLLPESARGRTGIAVCHCAVKRPATDGAEAIDVRFHYVSADLDEDDPEHEPHRQVVAELKSFADGRAAN